MLNVAGIAQYLPAMLVQPKASIAQSAHFALSAKNPTKNASYVSALNNKANKLYCLT